MSWMRTYRVLAACLLTGCSSAESAPSPSHDGGLAEAAVLADAADSLDDEDDGFEGCPDSIPAFALNMQATGEQGHISATLLAASNVPPLRYLNTWTVAFSAHGAPLSDVVLTKARPFMPVHGHDGIVQPTLETLALPGQIRIHGLNFNMRGGWEVQLTLSSESAGDDYVVFHICVQE